jgi:hypothetical protein
MEMATDAEKSYEKPTYLLELNAMLLGKVSN